HVLIRTVLTGSLVVIAACNNEPPAKRYERSGQILAVHADRQELAIRHGDIVGYMPGMTMSFPVATPSLIAGRTAGELVTATLEVTGLAGKIVAITHTGNAPLPDDTNSAAMTDGILAVGDALPDAALLDQANTRRSLSDWKGKPMLITFIYTQCPLPDFCPAMNRNFASIQRSLAADAALKGRLTLVSVSFDPEHDTPSVLAAFAAKHDTDPTVWTWLTGDRVTTDRLAAKFGVSVIRGDASPADVTHNLRTTLVDADGRIVRIYSGTDWTPAGVLSDLRGVIK
ncbi:MAG: SCO family protein, partial [Vicinamibacterales bacterium]